MISEREIDQRKGGFLFLVVSAIATPFLQTAKASNPTGPSDHLPNQGRLKFLI